MNSAVQKILIVDDSGELRKILRLTLGYGDFLLLEAEDGPQALELAQREMPRIVVLDIMMPGMDGLEVCRQLKAMPQTAHSAVIMLTALDQKSERAEGLKAGADHYVTKPFSPVALVNLIESILAGRPASDTGEP